MMQNKLNACFANMKKMLLLAAVSSLALPLMALTPEELGDLKQRASRMDSEALHELMKLSAEAGSGVTGKEIIRYCTMAAGQDDVEAQVFLYKCYSTGKSVSPDAEMANMWKESVISSGKAEALFMLGQAMMESKSSAERTEGRKLCLRAAENGCAEAKAMQEKWAAEQQAEEEHSAAEAKAAEEARAFNRSDDFVRDFVHRYMRVGETLTISEMASLYEPTICNLADGSALTLEQHWQECREYAARWPLRQYDILAVASNGRFIEIQMTYACTNAKGKTVRGYSKATLQLSPGGKIEGVGDDSSPKNLPPFSAGMKRISWY